jgi:hypothetical protein
MNITIDRRSRPWGRSDSTTKAPLPHRGRRAQRDGLALAGGTPPPSPGSTTPAACSTAGPAADGADDQRRPRADRTRWRRSSPPPTTGSTWRPTARGRSGRAAQLPVRHRGRLRGQDGRLGRLRNPTYTGIGPHFGGRWTCLSSDRVMGTPNCGKGHPGQTGHRPPAAPGRSAALGWGIGRDPRVGDLAPASLGRIERDGGVARRRRRGQRDRSSAALTRFATR